MEFTPDQVSEQAIDQAEHSEAPDTATDVGCGAAVCVSAVEMAGLSEASLRARIKQLGRAESKLAAMKSVAVAEMARQHNPVTAERVVREELQSSKRSARHDVKAAEQLATLEATSEALAAGDIPQDHARRIARASSEGPIDEQALVEAAKTENYEDFEKTLRRQQQEMSDDDGQSILDAQRKKRNLRMFKTKDTGMFILNGEFDPSTGDHIAAVVALKERELWHQEDPNARRTPQQRMADALAELILEPEKTNATGIALVLVADYDATHRELKNARLSDGSPLPMPELVRLALKANISISKKEHADPDAGGPGGGSEARTRRHRPPSRLGDRTRRTAGSPLHHQVVKGRHHRLLQPRTGVQRLPPQHPRRLLASHPTPRNRPLDHPTPTRTIPRQHHHLLAATKHQPRTAELDSGPSRAGPLVGQSCHHNGHCSAPRNLKHKAPLPLQEAEQESL